MQKTCIGLVGRAFHNTECGSLPRLREDATARQARSRYVILGEVRLPKSPFFAFLREGFFARGELGETRRRGLYILFYPKT
jgi:hypothetical protein